MQQHPIPQNITGFEFKLVGFLTLKQFGYLATAGVLSFIFFLAIPGFLKWIFITPLVLLGLAFAFMPVNGVTFDKWLLLFIQIITAPSKRLWKKEAKQISILDPAFSYYLKRAAPTPSVAPVRPSLESLLAQIKTERQINKLDALETTKLRMIDFGEEEGLSVWRGEPVETVQEGVVTTEPETLTRPSGPKPEAEKEPQTVEAARESFAGLAGESSKASELPDKLNGPEPKKEDLQ